MTELAAAWWAGFKDFWVGPEELIDDAPAGEYDPEADPELRPTTEANRTERASSGLRATNQW